MKNHPILADSIELENSSPIQIEEQNEATLALTPEVIKFYMHRATQTKEQVDNLGAETAQRQDKMRFVNDLIAEINNLTDEKNTLDITNHPELQEKFRMAKELGVNIPADKLQFTSLERDRLVENLHLTGSNWDKENKTQTQKIEILIKELDRIMLLLKEANKNENQAKRTMIHGIKS